MPWKTLVVDFILLKLKLKLKNKILLSQANIFKQRIKEIQEKKKKEIETEAEEIHVSIVYPIFIDVTQIDVIRSLILSSN